MIYTIFLVFSISFISVLGLPVCGPESHPFPIQAPFVLEMEKGEYVDNMDCHWIVSGASRITTYFWSVEECCDILTVRDGNTSTSPVAWIGGSTPPTLCSVSTSYYINWRSDASISGDTWNGFQMIIEGVGITTCDPVPPQPGMYLINCDNAQVGATCQLGCVIGRPVGDLSVSCDACGAWSRYGGGYCLDNVLTCGSSVQDTNVGRLNESVFYALDVPTAGYVTLTTCDPATNYDSILVLYNDSALTTFLAANDDDPTCGLNSTISVYLTPGQYYLRVTGYRNFGGQYRLTVNCGSDCPASDFKCPSGRCIPNFFRCDGVIDCEDASDEKNCNTTAQCRRCNVECLGRVIRDVSVQGNCDSINSATQFLSYCVRPDNNCVQTWSQQFCGALVNRTAANATCDDYSLIIPENCFSLYTCLIDTCQEIISPAALCGGTPEAIEQSRCNRHCRETYFGISSSDLEGCLAGCACNPELNSYPHDTCMEFCMPDNNQTFWVYYSYSSPYPVPGDQVGTVISRGDASTVAACLDGCGYRDRCESPGRQGGGLQCGMTVIDSNIGQVNVGGSPSPDVVYNFTLTKASNVIFSTCNPGTNFDTTLKLYSSNHFSNDSDLIVVAEDDSYCVQKRHSTIGINLLPWTYYLVVTGYDSNEGNYTLTISCGDLQWDQITCGSKVSGRTDGEANLFPETNSGDVIYEVLVADQVKMKFTTCDPGTRFYTRLVLFTDHELTNRIADVSRDESCPYNTNFATLDITLDRGTYYLVVTGQGKQESIFKLSVDCELVSAPASSQLGVGVGIGVAVVVLVIFFLGFIAFLKRKAISEYVLRQAAQTRFARFLDHSAREHESSQSNLDLEGMSRVQGAYSSPSRPSDAAPPPVKFHSAGDGAVGEEGGVEGGSRSSSQVEGGPSNSETSTGQGLKIHGSIQ